MDEGEAAPMRDVSKEEAALMQDLSREEEALMRDVSTRASRQFGLGGGSSRIFETSRSTMVWTSTIPSKIGGAVLWPLKPLKKVMKGSKMKDKSSKESSKSKDTRPSLESMESMNQSIMLSNLFDNNASSTNNNDEGNQNSDQKIGGRPSRKRNSILTFRKRQQRAHADSLQEFDREQSLSRSGLVPSSLLATGRSLSINSLQDSYEASKSHSFKHVNSSTNSEEVWHNLIKPFVSDLAFNSIVTRRSEAAVCFDPHTCEAAVLFVDLSGYSKITAAISHKGAHAISAAVNAYLDRLLKIIDRFGGDVIKFAGDAVLVVWAGEEEGDDDELEYNLLCASKCAVELQKQAGIHPVAGTEHAFRIHCGICCGMIESEIFAAPTHANMQRLFHSLSGQCLKDITELVDLAKSGQTAISTDVADYLGTRGIFEDIKGVIGALLLTDLELEPILEEAMDQHITDSKEIRAARRIKGSEEDFIHPNVLRLLRYGGLTPTQIAQMRNLCVLFIAQTSSGNSVNWLMEVQGVLDRYRCPIIQIIDDDKGTHVIAAVNLCESVPESAVLGLDACRELVKKKIGCAIGVAMGSTFCGVTGSAGIACRWDITGPHPVRAARLMQYAVLNKVEVAIDSSLLEDPLAATRMTILDPVVEIKGSPEPCTVYGLSGSKLYSVFRLLETSIGDRVQNRAVNQVRKCINTGRTRCAVILTGAPFTGKKDVARAAAALSEFVPFTHVCNETAGLAQLARTIAIWYQYVKNKKIRKKAAKVLDHIDSARFSKAHDECVELVFNAVDEGLRACFVVDRIQFLDSFSLSIMRGCLEGRTEHGAEGAKGIIRVDPSADDFGAGSVSGSEVFSSTYSNSKRGSEYRKGKVVFIGCHLSLYNRKSAEEMVNDITRGRRTFRVKIVEVGEPNIAEMRSLIREKFDLEPDYRWLRCHAEASGVALAYFLERAKAIRSMSKDASNHESRGCDVVTKTLALHIPTGYIHRVQQCPLSEVSADMAMKTLQLFDDLPPLFQTLTKIIAIATRRAQFKIPSIVAWKVMNDLYGELDSDRYGVVIREMKEMHLLKVVVDKNMDKMSFSSPIVADVAMSTCTPSQIRFISEALVWRLESMMSHDFKVPLVLADLYHQLRRDEEKKKDCWRLAYKGFLKAHKHDPHPSQVEHDWWIEYFSDVISLAGYSPSRILGKQFVAPVTQEEEAPAKILQLREHCGPMTLGPMGHTLSVLSRNMFHDYGASIREDDDEKAKIRDVLIGARRRYFKEVVVIERFLRESGLEAGPKVLEAERSLLFDLTTPSLTGEDVLGKAERFLDELTRDFVQPRMERIRDFVTCIDGIPEVVTSCKEEALAMAYKKVVHGKCWKDKTEDALMALAVNNWKPRAVQDCATLPVSHLQTICRIRDKFLKQRAVRNGDEMSGQQEYLFSDFQGFIIMTALLYNAMDAEEEVFDQPKLMRQRTGDGSTGSVGSLGSLGRLDEDKSGWSNQHVDEENGIVEKTVEAPDGGKIPSDISDGLSDESVRDESKEGEAEWDGAMEDGAMEDGNKEDCDRQDDGKEDDAKEDNPNDCNANDDNANNEDAKDTGDRQKKKKKKKKKKERQSLPALSPGMGMEFERVEGGHLVPDVVTVRNSISSGIASEFSGLVE